VSTPTLCIGLRFRRGGATASQWEQTLRGLLAWDPALRPTALHRRDEPGGAPDEPWSDGRWPELARRCAIGGSWSWGLENRTGSGTSLDVAGGQHQVEILIAVDRPGDDLAAAFEALLDAVRGGAEPALGFLYDCADPGRGEFVFQGLHRLEQVPPLLYLDAAALQTLGGRHKLSAAPCRQVDTTGGGLLLDVADPWRTSTATRERSAEVGRVLGISAASPASFLDAPT
jgi:hypothetical protein